MIHLLLVMIYLSFISLGLPDALLGSAWPVMHQTLAVDVSYAGVISLIISFGTIISSLQSDRLTKTFGPGKVTAFSVLLTAVALFGFSISNQFWMLCLWAIPYGLGAGSVDASLNNYVALHYKSHHMSWLHCMWGVGAAIGPYIMSYALTNGSGWQSGYLYIAIIQIVLTTSLFISLPLWQTHEAKSNGKRAEGKPLSIPEILSLKGAKEIMIAFFCYCAIESTAGLWASSYFVLVKGIEPETAAGYAALFYIGITVGRALSGFLTFKFNDEQMIRIGIGVLATGIILLLLPIKIPVIALMSLIIIGLGCAPIYPSIIHMSPRYFGKDKSQAIIGVQMASAYVGAMAMPPIFGWITKVTGMGILPIYLGLLTILMLYMSERFTQNGPVEEEG
ncbi:MFS transporter [Globicatella sp. HMSC072A10]|uniref:MFS transporter n=1 Tax=Globicatella sp. HMSC072A10 TaxID=1739315 RepID=UPI0008ADA79C|nr:MFS transporter [Globicatella sp. HMSC072A10]OFK59978.1 MFS transporter [Globicatella sp. HMSC072A10]